MKYGFIIDNRKCIGCHACTTACKSEHNVAVGVNRTWVKQVEKGQFPHTRRLFSVMRCNHCTDAPCVEICPVEALFIREDGIVDFNNERCIACKSCMQACPYDALYIDPETSTAAKCNYCAHRVDVGLEPACVNVCPEHAIISGDMEDPDSEIFELLNREQVTVRKAEKGTQPNLFYINGDAASLTPTETDRSDQYFWSSQSSGVGHFARHADKMAFSNGDVVQAVMEANGQSATAGEVAGKGATRSIDLMLGKSRRVYDSPDKGVLWGWEVSGYVMTKAIAAGAFLLLFLGGLFGYAPETLTATAGLAAGLVFLGLTGVLLIMDLDQPKRFLYVLLRPQWKSWLVRGGYTISVYGGLLTLLLVGQFLDLGAFTGVINWITAVFAILTAVYTAFLFAQAKGRDFWQSPTLALHMLVHSVMAGAALYGLLTIVEAAPDGWMGMIEVVFITSIAVNLVILTVELVTPHPTTDSKRVVKMITSGRFRNRFWFGSVLIGNMVPLAIALLMPGGLAFAVASLLVIIGIYQTEKIWVEAPQRVPLS